MRTQNLCCASAVVDVKRKRLKNFNGVYATRKTENFATDTVIRQHQRANSSAQMRMNSKNV